MVRRTFLRLWRRCGSRYARAACRLELFVHTHGHRLSRSLGNGRRVFSAQSFSDRTKSYLGGRQNVSAFTAADITILHVPQARVSRLWLDFHGRIIRSIRSGVLTQQARIDDAEGLLGRIEVI